MGVPSTEHSEVNGTLTYPYLIYSRYARLIDFYEVNGTFTYPLFHVTISLAPRLSLFMSTRLPLRDVFSAIFQLRKDVKIPSA